MNSTPAAVLAGLFHAGNTCPFCQETISAGQLIIACPGCGSIHHETCWTHKNGCSSYHCDQAVRMENPSRPADFVLTFEEVAAAPPPPPPRKPRLPQEVAAAYLPPAPTRTSRMAIAAVCVAGLSLVGVVGVLKSMVEVIMLGIALAFLGMALSVIALIRIGKVENRISGMPLAVGGTLAPVALVIIYFVLLGASLSTKMHQQRVNLQLLENLPTEEKLDKMPAGVANAMRSNVVVRVASGLEQSFGSGILVNLSGHQAYILTNKHVIGSAKSGVQVLFYTGEESMATVAWEAPEGVDLAILSCQVIALKNFRLLQIAPEQVSIGQQVFAVGNPMGLSWTYTEGTISSHRRTAGGPHGIDLYQTQTPINSGNSGGGLFTRDGQLVGINTLTEDKQTAEGLSFAIGTTTFLDLLSAQEKKDWLGMEEAGK